MGNDSHCQMTLLQIDAYLDKELDSGQEQALLAHASQCASCATELEYAMALHQQVTNLPLMDCPDSALEPIEHLMSSTRKRTAGFGTRSLRLPGFFGSFQPGFNLAMAGATAIALVVGFALGRMGESPVSQTQLAQEETSRRSESYTQEEIIRAIEDMEMAISYLQEVTERTGSLVESQLLEQVRISVNASSSENGTPGASNGPI